MGDFHNLQEKLKPPDLNFKQFMSNVCLFKRLGFSPFFELPCLLLTSFMKCLVKFELFFVFESLVSINDVVSEILAF